jgi:hypothetical protein
MPRYSPVNTTSDQPTPPRRQSSTDTTTSRQRSFSFRRNHSRSQSILPDPNEMDAAFDGPADDDEMGEADGLLGRRNEAEWKASGEEIGKMTGGRIPGEYDFDRDYVGSWISAHTIPYADSKSSMARHQPHLPHLSSRILQIILHRETLTVYCPLASHFGHNPSPGISLAASYPHHFSLGNILRPLG